MSYLCTAYVWEQVKGVNPAAKLVLLKIADNAHDDGTGAYGSIKYMADRCDITPRGVRKSIRELEEAGEIHTLLNEGSHTQSGKTNSYILIGYRKALGLHPTKIMQTDLDQIQLFKKKQGRNSVPLTEIDRNTVPSREEHSSVKIGTVFPQGRNTVPPEPSVEPSVEPSYEYKEPSTIPPLTVKIADGGGGSWSKALTPSSATSQSLDPRQSAIIALITEIISDRLPQWNNSARFVSRLRPADAMILLTWLWAWDLLSTGRNPYTTDSAEINEENRIKREYQGRFANCHNPVGLIQKHVNSGASANLAPPDAAELEEAICARTENAVNA